MNKENINKLFLLLFPSDYSNKLVVGFPFFYFSDKSVYDFHIVYIVKWPKDFK